MCNVKSVHKTRGLLSSVLNNRCPRCREGELFTVSNPFRLRTTMRMPEHCAVCGQPFELQTGFYFGTGYVSYFLSVGFLLIAALIWHLTIGFSFANSNLYAFLGIVSAILLVTQPLQQRLARSIWIACFVRYQEGERRYKR